MLIHRELQKQIGKKIPTLKFHIVSEFESKFHIALDFEPKTLKCLRFRTKNIFGDIDFETKIAFRKTNFYP